MPLLAIVALAAGTYAFRLAGPVFRQRVRMPEGAQRLFSVAAAVLLIALAATSALTQGHGFAGWARPAGVAVAGWLHCDPDDLQRLTRNALEKLRGFHASDPHASIVARQARCARLRNRPRRSCSQHLETNLPTCLSKELFRA